MDRDKLIKKLKRLIKPSIDLKGTSLARAYYSCGAKLIDNKRIDCACFIDKTIYYNGWGDVPEGRSFIDLSEIKDISESDYRLPVELAQKIYDSGETGMGYFRFVAVMKDGKRFTYVTGGLVDFLEPPIGYNVRDIVDVIPGGGGYSDDWRYNHYKAKKYYWCLVEDL